MKHRSCAGSWVHGLLLIVALMPAGIAAADESGRRYDSENRFQGSYRVTETGTIRLYDENGRFEGTVVPKRDGDGYRRYDSENRYLGSLRRDDATE